MAALRMQVSYLDGRTVEAVAVPKVLIMTEEKFGGIPEEKKVSVMFFMAWAALSHAGKESAGFDDWLDLVDDVDAIEAPLVQDRVMIAAG